MKIPGQGESAPPEDKREEAMKNLEEDWQDDQANPRNWPFRKKWTAVAVVSEYTYTEASIPIYHHVLGCNVLICFPHG